MSQEQVPELGSMLIAEIGSVSTRVVLVDMVEGEFRLISQAEKPSSIEPPYKNPTIAILEAAAQITEMTGIRLLNEGQLLMPQTKERNGINHVVAITSAAGALALNIAAIASDISAKSALHACHSNYTNVLYMITLDEYSKSEHQETAGTIALPIADQADKSGKKSRRKKKTAEVDEAIEDRSGSARSWIDTQVEAMLATEPDLVVIAGGLDGGAIRPLIRLAHIVALTTFRTDVDSSGLQHQHAIKQPVIYAGNSDARDEMQSILEGQAETFVVENVRPNLEQENLEPAIREIDRLYHETVLPKLPGFSILQGLCNTPITTVRHAQGLTTRFLAERYKRQIVTVDVGSTSTSAFYAGPGTYHISMLGTCGTGYGITSVMKESGLSNIRRWLPFNITNKELLDWILNKLMRPHLIPSTREDLLIEHAVAREALRLVMNSLRDQCPLMPYDLVVACGGVLAHAPPGLAALTLLDALQYASGDSVNVLNLHLDALGLMSTCGALAGLEPDAAVTVAERDMLTNIPLATCVITFGDGKLRRTALQAELTTVGGRKQKVKVRHGEIVRLPLVAGEYAQLTLKPTAGVRIGRNAPGKDVKSNPGEIGGSLLGIIIDARGRPLRMDDDPNMRRLQIWDWLVAMGVEEGVSPYVDPSIKRSRAKRKQEQDEEDEELLVLSDMPELEGIDMEGSPREEGTQADGQPVATGTEPGEAVDSEQGIAAVSQEGNGKGGGRISLADLDLANLEDETQRPSSPASLETPPEPGSIESDLASLRQTVAEPEKPDKKKKKKGGAARKKKR